MTPKLIKTSLAEYVPATWSGKNESGLLPLGDHLVVSPDLAAAKSSGGIELPEDIVARMSLSAEGGVVVAVGDGAFVWNSDKVTPFEGRKPQPGDRVCMHRYSGQVHLGTDGVTYRILSSSEIGAIVQ